MKKLTLTSQDYEFYKKFIGFTFEPRLSDLKHFHHCGPWLFHKMYELFGISGSMQIEGTKLIFKLSNKKVSAQKYIKHGWFVLEKTGKGSDIGYGTHIAFYTSISSPLELEDRPFAKMRIDIGYHHYYDHGRGSGLAWNEATIVRDDITPTIAVDGPKFENKAVDNAFKTEMFLVMEIIRRLVIPFSSKMYKKFDRKKTEEFKKEIFDQMSKQLV